MKLFTEANNYSGNQQKPWFTGTLCAGCLLLFLSLGTAPDTIVYNRAAIAQGELWRLITGHFAHCDFSHLAWNLVPLLLIAGLLEQRLGARVTAGVTLISCLGVSGWLWFTQTDLPLYCGLSGMLNGLLAVLLATLWQESRHPAIPLIGLAALLKIIFEIASREAVFTHLSWAGLPGAHGAGMAVGIIYLGLVASSGKGSCCFSNRNLSCKEINRV